jgi:hypothetical protein
MYHSSPVEIKEITSGLYGTGLFFGSSSDCGFGPFVYEIEDVKSCTATHLRYEFCDNEPEVVAFAKKWNISLEVAFDIVTGKESEYNHIDCCVAGEAGWEAQGIALVLAMRAGYEAVELEDENGTVWLVDGHVAIKKWREI